MKYGKVSDDQYLLRLEKGEAINSVLKIFCEKQGIKNGELSGLGSIENPTLAHYFVDTKKYSEKTLEGVFEVTNLTGTIGLSDNQPLVHIHMTLSDESMQAFGGHLVKGLVSATLEVMLKTYKTTFEKKFSEEIGLNLFELPEEIR